MKAEPQEEFAALIGIDWADRRHAVCLQVQGTSWRFLPSRRNQK